MYDIAIPLLAMVGAATLAAVIVFCTWNAIEAIIYWWRS